MFDLLGGDKENKVQLVKNGEGLADYLAFNAQDRNKYLEIKTTKGINRAPAYAYLLDVISDGERGTEISLLFSFMMIEIRGKNLQELAHALAMRGCSFIQEFSPKAFSQPEPSATIIESIEIVAKK